VLCLNIGTDPPDVVRPTPCARVECWKNTVGIYRTKAAEEIGNALEKQYEKWQSKAKYKLCLDPTSDELRRVSHGLRKTARSDRLLVHYNGHGVPKPTANGELWCFGRNLTHYAPLPVSELCSWFGRPSVYVLDCSGAGILLPFFNAEHDQTPPLGSGGERGPTGGGRRHDADSAQSALDNDTMVLAACRADELLPMNPQYPADIFTACLTSPIRMAVWWFVLQNPFSMAGIDPDIASHLSGKENDRKTPRGELNWIFTAITDTIAWSTLPRNVFQKMFRQDLLVASLFRNFLLAMRVMKSFNCHPQSHPPLSDSICYHKLWHAWDLAVESAILRADGVRKGTVSNAVRPSPSPSPFFTEHLTAFEVWLTFGGFLEESPPHLPILLQELLSQAHRPRALQLLKRYVAMGSEAVNLSLIVGIFPYILKLLQSPQLEIRQTLICIWTCILGFDKSCRAELMKEGHHKRFMDFMISPEAPLIQRCKATFVLAELCDGFAEAKSLCFQRGLLQVLPSCFAVCACACACMSYCVVAA